MNRDYIQLNWNNHQNVFLENLSSLRDKQVFTDVTISCKDHFYPAHRLVLSACSSYFAEALEVAPCKSPVLLLHGISPTVLEALIHFMYDGKVTVSNEELPALLAAGQWLGIRGLEDAASTLKGSGLNLSSIQATQFAKDWFSVLASASEDGSIGQSDLLPQFMTLVEMMQNSFGKEALGNKKSGNKKAEKQQASGTVPIGTEDTNNFHSSEEVFMESFDECKIEEHPIVDNPDDSLIRTADFSQNITESNTSGIEEGLVEKEEFEAKRKPRKRQANKRSEAIEKGNEVVVGTRALRCRICQMGFKVRDRLAKHMRLHMNNNSATQLHKVREPVIRKRVKRSTSNRQHVNKHNGFSRVSIKGDGKTRIYSCPHCSYTNSNKNMLYDHMASAHKDKRPHACPYCKYCAGRKRTIDDHVRNIHTGNSRFTCPHCHYGCSRPNVLRIHLSKKHGNKSDS